MNSWRCITKHKSKWDNILIKNKIACHRTTNIIGNDKPVFEGFRYDDLVKWFMKSGK